MPDSKPSQLRRLLLSALAAAALLLLLALLAPFLVPWNSLKDKAVEAASKSLGRELRVGRVELSLFSGVHLRDLSLANAPAAEGFSAQPLFSNAEARLRLSLLPLLRGRVVVDSITFRAPRILLETNAAGRNNLPGLGASPAQPAAPAAVPAAAAFPLAVRSLRVEGGELVLRDARERRETAVRGLDLALSGFSLDGSGSSHLQISLKAELEGKSIPLSLDARFRLDAPAEKLELESLSLQAPALGASLSGGLAGFSRPSADLALHLQSDLARLRELLPPSALAALPAGFAAQGRLELDAKLKGSPAEPGSLDLRGALALEKAAFSYSGGPPLSGVQGRLSFDAAGVELPTLDFAVGGDTARLAFRARWGSLAALLGPPAALKVEASYELKAARLNLDPLVDYALAEDPPAPPGAKPAPLPDYSRSLPRGLSLKGLIQAESLRARGFSTGPLRHSLQLKERRLSSAGSLQLYGGSLLESSGADLGKPGPVFASSIKLQGLRFKDLAEAAAASAPANKGLQALKGRLEGSLSLDAKLEGRGLKKPWRLDNTRARAEFHLREGLLRKTELQEKVALAVPWPPAQQALRAELRFADASGLLLYGAGRRLELKSFNLGSGPDWRSGSAWVQASGTWDLAGPLAFRIVPHLNPAQLGLAGETAQAFADEKGWPSFDYVSYAGPDLGSARADFTAGLKKAAGKALERRLEPVKQELQKKAGELLQQLPGLLGR